MREHAATQLAYGAPKSNRTCRQNRKFPASFHVLAPQSGNRAYGVVKMGATCRPPAEGPDAEQVSARDKTVATPS